jgi:uncharacterized membrane protein YdjX (TVP38/TMEM64 family)
VISYSAALSGAVTVFVISRKWGKSSVRKLLKKNRHMRSIVRAIEKKGFKVGGKGGKGKKSGNDERRIRNIK